MSDSNLNDSNVNEASTSPSAQPSQQQPKKENMLLNIALNIVAPTLILTKLSGEDALGPTYALIFALAFPIGYGLMDYFRTGKMNIFSAIGVVSVTLTGGMTLLKLPPEYIAIKEAAIPALFGIAILISLKTRYPLVKTFMMNPSVMQVDKIQHAVEERKSEKGFERALTMSSLMLAGSFFLSSVLNYGLAKYLLVSEPGSAAFNEELGKMTAMSIPVISVPTFIVFIAAMIYLFKQIKKHTGLGLEEIMITPEEGK